MTQGPIQKSKTYKYFGDTLSLDRTWLLAPLLNRVHNFLIPCSKQGLIFSKEKERVYFFIALYGTQPVLALYG